MKVTELSTKDILNAGRENTNSSPITLCGLVPEAQSFALSQVLVSHTHKFSTLIICPDETWAQNLHQSLELFLPKSTVITSLESPPSPYRHLLPSPSYRWDLLGLLDGLTHASTQSFIGIIPADLLIHSRISPQDLIKRSIALRVKENHDPLELVRYLGSAGYEQRELVEERGCFSLRGEILDIFPPSQDMPIRLEFFDTELERIRCFQPSNQRSLPEEIAKVFIGPAREFDCSLEGTQSAREKLKLYCDEREIPKAKRDRYSDLLQKGIAAAEFDYFLPLFQQNSSLLEHIGAATSLVLIEPQLCGQSISAARAKLEQEFERIEKELVLEPAVLLLDPQDLQKQWQQKAKLFLEQIPVSRSHSQPIELSSRRLNASGKEAKNEWLDEIPKWLRDGQEVSFVANAEVQIERFGFLLHQRKIPFTRDIQTQGKVTLLTGAISSSFSVDQDRKIFLSEEDFFGKKLRAKSVKKAAHHQPQVPQLKSLDMLQVGEAVVHAEHGIGRYIGLSHMQSGGVRADYVLLEYADKDKLYLPIYRLELLQKYVGDGSSHPPLDRLGSQGFAKTKERVKKAVKDIAADLLKLYASRSQLEGFSFAPPDDVFHEFAANFPFDETPDQQRAIDETIHDMCGERPMDRLICGDVGFGKTEVALRAAMLAVLSHKQVAVLVPTTVLAEQHLQSFRQRFKNFPVKVAGLSRFKSAKEQKETCEAITKHEVDIVIGTHRLLSKDVKFADLGLLVIDEEQRFGVEHKETLKRLKLNTDVLTLSATPIPRTLHMSLIGLRDISQIQSPPVDRFPIRTTMSSFDPELIKSAIELELQRGGQVFFIHNRVQSIEAIHQILRGLMPNVRVGVAHGQMPERALEKVMMGFYQKEFDVLLCTAIVENGLDVPSANTIIINRADSFGLSQLYQLRGRVGRSQTKAFAYLLVPESGKISDEARERLHLLQRFVSLGSGYAIASHDLEMRGGGDLLGASQSGHIAAVGYDLYLDLLQEEIQSLKGEKQEKVQDVEISTCFPALLPQEYVIDTRMRLSLYKRLSEAKTKEDVDDAFHELLERYGPLPSEAQELLELLYIKALMRRIGLKALTISRKNLVLEAGPNLKLSHQELLQQVKRQPDCYQFDPDGKLVIKKTAKNNKDALEILRSSLPGLT